MKTIRDFIDIIDTKFGKKSTDQEVDYVSAIVQLEDENTGKEFEIFRIINIDNNTENVTVQDFEYSNDENTILEWKAEADYYRLAEVDLNDEESLKNVILWIDNFLLEDYLFEKVHDFDKLV